MKKNIKDLRDDFSKQLEEAANQIAALTKKAEELRVRQQQLIGAVYALDMVQKLSEAEEQKTQEEKFDEV